MCVSAIYFLSAFCSSYVFASKRIFRDCYLFLWSVFNNVFFIHFIFSANPFVAAVVVAVVVVAGVVVVVVCCCCVCWYCAQHC